MKLSEKVGAIVWAFPADDPRCDMVREIVKEIETMRKLVTDMRYDLSEQHEEIREALRAKNSTPGDAWRKVQWVSERLQTLKDAL